MYRRSSCKVAHDSLQTEGLKLSEWVIYSEGVYGCRCDFTAKQHSRTPVGEFDLALVGSATFGFMDPERIELLTSALRTRRSPN